MFNRIFQKFMASALAVSLTFSYAISGLSNVEAVEVSKNETIVINNATEIGDCNASGEVNILDLVRMKKHLIGTSSLDETLSDIKSDTVINSQDIIALRKILLGVAIGDIAYPRIEKTKYNTTEVIVADTNVRMFGAVGDGKTDDTAAFTAAMKSLGTNGGTVYVPAGRYKLTNNINIPYNVTLQGDFADPKLYDAGEAKNGSVLEIYTDTVEQGNNKAFFTMQSYTALRGFMIWYPEQKLDSGIPTEYPYTIELTDWQSINLRDLYLVNPYKAINDVRDTHNLETIQNIYMTPLSYGIEVAHNNDTARFENINIGSEWWLNSELSKNIPDTTELNNWMYKNTDGIRLYSIDSICASDITVNNCKTAVYTEGGYGRFYNFFSDDCYIGVDVCKNAMYGYTFTNGSINARNVAVRTATGGNGPVAFYNVDMSSLGANVVKNASDSGIALTECNISLAGDDGDYAILCEKGYITAVECDINKTNPSARCAYVSNTAIQNKFVNCNTAEAFDYSSETADNISVSFDEENIADFNTDVSGYQRQSKKPQKQVFYNAIEYMKAPDDVVIIDDENAVTGTSNIANWASNVETSIVKVGSKSLKSKSDSNYIVASQYVWRTTEFNTPKDITAVTSNGTDGALRFWFYIEDINSFDAKNRDESKGFVKIGTTTWKDSSTPNAGPDAGSFYKWNGWTTQVTKSGWNEIILKFEDASKQNGTPNLACIDKFMISYPDGTTATTAYIDDFKVSADTEPTTEIGDISKKLQSVIDNAAANGGGVVYLPSGDYSLQRPITVRSGVELRGSADRPHFGTAVNTTFVTDYGKNDKNGTALITLESNSGIRGITIDYSETRPNGIPYAYTIRGTGDNIYIVNCTVDSAWQVADFMTYRCDNHYIEAVNFGTLKTGIVIGGGSVDGVVRDCQSNPASNRDSRNTVRDDWFDENGKCLSNAWTLENVTGYIVNNAVNQIQSMNFVYGCVTGLEISGNTTMSTIGHGTDQADYGIHIDDNSNVNIISPVLPIRMGIESYGIYLTNKFSGITNIASAEIWAVGETGVHCGSGKLNVLGSIFSQGGKTALNVASGTARMASSLITGTGVNNNYDLQYKIGKNATILEVYGNILVDNKNAVLHTSSNLSGSDISMLDITTVSTESKNTIAFGTEEELYCSLDDNTKPSITKTTSGVNVSGMRYIEFDLYIPSDDYLDNCNQMQLKLSSSNHSGLNEITFGSNCFKNSMLVSGWNHIKLDINRYDSKSSFTNLDTSSVKRFYLECQLSSAMSGEIGVKNVVFAPSDYSDNTIYFSDYSSNTNWVAGAHISCHSSSDAHYRKDGVITYKRSGINVSEMDYFGFDFYIDNEELFNDDGVLVCIEITSSGTYDKAEAAYSFKVLKGVVSKGWNRITIPISSFNINSTDETFFDTTNVNFFRTYTTGTSELGIAVGNLYFGEN